MVWTDRIRQVKILLVVAAIIIAVASLVVSHFLTKDLETEEKNKMEIWAEAMRSLNNADENTDLSLVLKVLNENNTIPVIVLDSNGNVSDFRNIDVEGKDYADSLRAVAALGRKLKASGRCIRIDLNSTESNSGVGAADSEMSSSDANASSADTEKYSSDANAGSTSSDMASADVNGGSTSSSDLGPETGVTDSASGVSSDNSASSKKEYIDVVYDESRMLKRLAVYPFVQLGVVMLFVVIAIFALLTSKKAEQNKVWVGLSKETAHQLGTPISSLMAWIEILKENYPNDDLIPEMDKDVQRLQLIAERFSKIGSLPEPVPTSLNEVMDHVIDYMDRRTSKKVHMIKEFPDHDIIVNLNASLFEWVIENLSKNAVDAMGGGPGTITLHVEETADKAIIEVSDTGKGIRGKDFKNVFRPGFTTKKRGWGLGLSLAKRIVSEYHKGRIFVKSSEPDRGDGSLHGTTFRIELPK